MAYKKIEMQDYAGIKFYPKTTADIVVTSSGETLESIAAKANGASNPNLLINGGFDVWQELENYTFKGGSQKGYCADQWMFWSYGAGSEVATITRTEDGLRVQHNGYTGQTCVHQTLPDPADSKKLAGKVVTMSFEATIPIGSSIRYAIRNCKIFGNFSGGSGTDIASTYAAGTGNKQVYTITGTVPEDVTDLCVLFQRSGSSNPNIDYTLHWVKLELGSAATPYVPENATLELLRCMRHYWRPKGTFATHNVIADTIYLYAGLWFPVPMRTTPTVIPYETLNVSYPDNPEGYKFGAENWGAPNHVWKFGHYDRTDYKRVTDITVNKDRIDMFVINDNTNTAGEKFECHLEIDARRYS